MHKRIRIALSGIIICAAALVAMPSTVSADVAPPSCENGLLSSIQCKKDLETDRYCRILRGDPSGYSEEDIQRQAKRSQETRCGGPGAAGSSGSTSCNQLIEACIQPGDVLRTRWFLAGLVTTIVIETLLVIAITKRRTRKDILTLVLANAATYTALSYFLAAFSVDGVAANEYRAALIGAEILVVLIEAAVIAWRFGFGTKRSLAISAAVNAASVAVGFVAHYVGWF